MKKIIGLLIMISFDITVEHVAQTYDNGMPKVIKIYNSYGSKLSLTKETGYYFDGSRQYEIKYNKGKVISNNRWTIDGKKQINNASWTLEQRKEAQGTLCQGAPSQEACDCVVSAISKEISFSEFKILEDSDGPGDPNVDENLKQRAMALKSSSSLQECVAKFPVDRSMPDIQVEDLERMLKESVDENGIEQTDPEPAGDSKE